MLLPFFLVACDGSTSTDDTGSRSKPDQEEGPTLSVDFDGEAATSAELTWDTPTQGTSWVQIVDEDGLSYELHGVDVDGRSSGRMLAPAGSELEAWVVLEDADGTVEGPAVSFTVGDAPANLELPTIRHSDPSSQVAANQLLYTAYTPDAAYVVLVTGSGEPIWYALLDDGEADMGGIPARIATDGRGVLVQHQLIVHTDGTSVADMRDTEVRRIGWGGEVLERWATPFSHHLADQPEPGTLVYLRADERTAEGVTAPVVFEQVVELDLDSGQERILFDTEALGLDKTCTTPSYYGDSCDPYHANSVDCDPDTGLCVLSVLQMETVVVFERATGEVVADLSDFHKDFLDPDQFAAFSGAHDVQWTAEGIQVFNNGVEVGWGSALAVDLEATTMDETFSYGLDDCVVVQAQGGMSSLDDEVRLVNYGVPSGLLREVTASGEVLFEAAVGDLRGGDPCGGNVSLNTVLGESQLVRASDLPASVVIIGG